MRSREWWDRWFIDLAQYVSTASKDPSTKVGCVIFKNKNEIVSVGYNGFPRGIEDTEERLNNRDVKLKLVIHAEINAIRFARGSLEGATIATWPFQACSSCAGRIIQEGITRCIAPRNDNIRWKDEFALANELFYEAKVAVTLY